MREPSVSRSAEEADSSRSVTMRDINSAPIIVDAATNAYRPANEQPFQWSLYRPFFRRSAQRFFIASDNRFLPSAVRRPRLILFALGAETGAFPFEVATCKWLPSSAAMTPLSRSLSLFNPVYLQDS